MQLTIYCILSVALFQAVVALERYPCNGTRSALGDIIHQTEAFYKVRVEAVFCLAKVCFLGIFSLLNCVFHNLLLSRFTQNMF